MRDQAFERFVSESLPVLGRYAYTLTGDRHSGEDLVQDTLVKLTAAWRRIRIDGNPIGYARTVMFRTYISRWRSNRRRPPAEPLDVEPASSADGYAAVDVRDALRRALRDLPRMQRAVLVLSYLDDMPDDQIAALLSRRPATVRSLRARGLAAVRSRIVDADQLEVVGGQD